VGQAEENRPERAPANKEQEASPQHQSSQQWRVWAVIFSLLIVAFVLAF